MDLNFCHRHDREGKQRPEKSKAQLCIEGERQTHCCPGRQQRTFPGTGRAEPVSLLRVLIWPCCQPNSPEGIPQTFLIPAEDLRSRISCPGPESRALPSMKTTGVTGWTHILGTHPECCRHSTPHVLQELQGNFTYFLFFITQLLHRHIVLKRNLNRSPSPTQSIHGATTNHGRDAVCCGGCAPPAHTCR